jgi:hypothetical protein
MSTTLDEVRSYMSFWGWSDGGNPGSTKRDAANNVIARHGDDTWMADVELACVTLMRLVNHTEPRD